MEIITLAKIPGALCGLCLLAIVPTFASAAQPWLAAHYGYAYRGASEFDGVEFRYPGIASHEFDGARLEKGPSYGFGLGADFTPAWALSFEYERLRARTASTTGWPALDVDLPVHQFKAAAWWRPYVRPRFRAGLGIGAGVGFLSGQVVSDQEGDPFIGDVSERSLVIDGQVLCEYAPLDRVWIVATAGARHLRFGEVDFGYTPMVDPATGAYVPLDYSGWLVRIGIKWELPGGSASG